MWLLNPFGTPDIYTTCLSNLKRSDDHRTSPTVWCSSKWKAVTMAKSSIASRSTLSSQWSWKHCSEQVNLTTTAPVQLLKLGTDLETSEPYKTEHPIWTQLTATKMDRFFKCWQSERSQTKRRHKYSQKHTERQVRLVRGVLLEKTLKCSKNTNAHVAG